ncbi:MAG: proline dehydrogenase [Ignavibacteriales bacterium CG_4_9_14_3_um_filter_30_11]|nr:MAG: proline dehydrogenase [Ignavibacteriales bacterium CG_4_9_14_3_um_filter_30_11]
MNPFNEIIVKIVQLMPKKLVWKFSKKYIAGETLQDAVSLVKNLNSIGILATIDVLGEAVTNKSEAIESKVEASKVIDKIIIENLNANLSIKPTQMGLSIDSDFAYEQISELVGKLVKVNNFLRLDMEDSPYTTLTIDLLKKLREKYNQDSVGIVIQSYLKRSLGDVKELNKINTNYRLCKGIYVEPSEIAYKEKDIIRNNYLTLLEEMIKSGNYVGIATHDEYLIDEAYKLIDKYKLGEDKFEFQMLLGVREDLRDKILKDGYKIRIYVPYGVHWYKYSIRRLKENPAIAGYIFKNLFSFK